MADYRKMIIASLMAGEAEDAFETWLKDIVWTFGINESAVKVPVEASVCLEWDEREVCDYVIVMAGIVPVPVEDCHIEKYCVKRGTTIVNETDEDRVCKELLKKLNISGYLCDIDFEGVDTQRLAYHSEIELYPLYDNITKEDLEEAVNKIAKALKDEWICDEVYTSVEEYTFNISGTIIKDLEGYVDCYFFSYTSS